MSYFGERYDIQKTQIGNIYVTQCGLTVCESNHQCKTRFYEHYSISFILEGKGTYYVNNEEYKLSAGQGLIIIPGKPIYYVADEKEPWKYIYVIFSGYGEKNLLYHAGLSDKKVTFSFDLSEVMLSNLYNMLNASKNVNKRGYDVTGYFMLVISEIIGKNSERPNTANLADYYISKAILFIEDNYFDKITVEDIASYLNIDRTYLYKIFMKNIKMSPTQYLLQFRLERAETMLVHSEMSICDIAMATGFYDQSHFDRRFSTRYGVSPRKYRDKKSQKK